LPISFFIKDSIKLNIWTHYLAPTSVGKNISEIVDRGTPGYRREGQESFRPRRLEMLWLWKALGDVISLESGQVYVTSTVFSSNGGVLGAVFVLPPSFLWLTATDLC
jgi:hypothetical protein